MRREPGAFFRFNASCPPAPSDVKYSMTIEAGEEQIHGPQFGARCGRVAGFAFFVAALAVTR
jgi:hypothetical protein